MNLITGNNYAIIAENKFQKMVNGVPTGDPTTIDLTNGTVYFTMKTKTWKTDTNDDDAVISIDNIVHFDAINGKTLFQLNLTADPGEYFANFKFKDSSGSTYESSPFSVSVLPQLTHRI